MVDASHKDLVNNVITRREEVEADVLDGNGLHVWRVDTNFPIRWDATGAKDYRLTVGLCDLVSIAFRQSSAALLALGLVSSVDDRGGLLMILWRVALGHVAKATLLLLLLIFSHDHILIGSPNHLVEIDFVSGSGCS